MNQVLNRRLSSFSDGRITVRQDRKRLVGEFWSKPVSLGVFDLQVRRKPVASAAVAVILAGSMDIE